MRFLDNNGHHIHITLSLTHYIYILFVSLLNHFWLIHFFPLYLRYQPYLGLYQAQYVYRNETTHRIHFVWYTLARACANWCFTVSFTLDISFIEESVTLVSLYQNKWICWLLYHRNIVCSKKFMYSFFDNVLTGGGQTRSRSTEFI